MLRRSNAEFAWLKQLNINDKRPQNGQRRPKKPPPVG
jgi:hypothetical protein